MKHQLSLEIPDVANETIMKIIDSSTYTNALAIDCARLEIIRPGGNEYIKLDVQKNFNKTITACDLELQFDHCESQRNSMPDGIYHIRYSISPNSRVYVEYYHLRITQTLNQYYSAVARTIAGGSCDPGAETEKTLRELTQLKRYMEAAKYEAEKYGNLQQGIQLVAYVQKKLLKYL